MVMALSCAVHGRIWTSIDGRKTQADLKSYDATSGMVILVRKGGREFRLDSKLLSEADNAYLAEWEEQRLEKARQEEGKVAAENAKAGTVVRYTTDGENRVSYHCYYPKNYTYQTRLPMLILFDPGGNGQGIMKAFKPVGDAHGLLVVGCDRLRNGMKTEEGNNLFAEMLPHMEKLIPHDSEQMYMGGMSGGAMRAYNYSAHFDRPWKGIVACGGWLGGAEYEGTKYRKRMVVAMVNGESDNNANAWVDHDTDELNGRSCKIKLFQFDGGHVLAPPDVLIEAVEWMIDNRRK